MKRSQVNRNASEEKVILCKTEGKRYHYMAVCTMRRGGSCEAI
jgi:hypothetical protein